MTISQKTRTQSAIKTLLNLSTSKRSLMLLWNPDEIQRDFWFVHVSFFGMSLVYFSLTTEAATYEDESTRCNGFRLEVSK